MNEIFVEIEIFARRGIYPSVVRVDDEIVVFVRALKKRYVV